MVAIIGLSIGGFIYYVDKRFGKERETIRSLKIHTKRLEQIHDAMVGVLVECSASLRLYQTLFARLLRQGTSNETLLKIEVEMASYEWKLQQALQEFLLYSVNIIQKDSAIRELSQEYGRLESLNIMKDLLAESPDNQSLSKGIVELEERIRNLVEKTYRSAAQNSGNGGVG
jgi:pyruvate-formate lyase